MVQKNTKTVIGIVPGFDEGQLFTLGDPTGRVYLRRDYLEAIANAGAVPLILHPEMDFDDALALCDGVVISGGLDIDPAYYEHQVSEHIKLREPSERFMWEKRLIEACDASDTPILGVCYGMQRLNIHYGGTLIQDIPHLIPDPIDHNNTLHEVTLAQPFLGLRSRVTYLVNSRHHQSLGVIAKGFKIRARTSDGVIEAFEGRGHYGVQWHPESDGTAARIYGSFAELCGQSVPESLADFLPEPGIA
jgi:putative glutamine amidotransferase